MTRGTRPRGTRHGLLNRRELPPLGNASRVTLCTFVLLGPLSYFGLARDFSQIPPTAGSAIAFLAVIGLVLSPRDRVLRAHVSLPAILLVAWTASSVFWTIDTTNSSLAVRQATSLSIGLMIAATVMPIDLFVKWLTYSFKLGIAVSAAALALVPSTRSRGAAVADAEAAWNAFFLSKNEFGLYVSLAFAVIATLGRSQRWQGMWLGLCVIMVIGSRSVTAIVTVASSLAMLWWIRRFLTLAPRLGTGFLAATFAAASALMAGAFFSVGLMLESVGKDPSLSGRTTIWSAVWDTAMERPVHGYGVNSLWNSVPAVTSTTSELWSEIGFLASHSHNGALEMLLELGAVGLGLYLVVYFGVATSAGSVLRTNPALGSWMIILLFNTLLISLSEPVTSRWMGILLAAHVIGIRVRSDDDPFEHGVGGSEPEEDPVAIA